MALQLAQANRLCELLANRSEPRHPVGAAASGLPSADPVLAAAVFLCAAEVANVGTSAPPTASDLADSVVSKVTASLGLLDLGWMVDLFAHEGRLVLHFKALEGTTKTVLVPSLPSQQRLPVLDAAILEVGVVLGTLVHSLKTSFRPLSPQETAGLPEQGRSFLAAVNSLLGGFREALAVTGAMIGNAVPWAIVTGEQRNRETLQQVINGGGRPRGLDGSALIAYRHLLQAAVVTDFLVTSLNDYIDRGNPLPDHTAVVEAVTNADPNWIVEPARSMLLETVAYSSNRTAKHSGNPQDALAHWMSGARFAWRGVMSSRIPRQAKYVAENLAQSAKVAGDPFGKRCADAIFCGAYTLGHLYSCIFITADKLQLKLKDGADSSAFLCGDGWLREWEAIPAYRDDPFFVQRFMADELKVTQDNLVVNTLAGTVLLEQFLRDVPAKRRQVAGIKQVHMLTAYAQKPATVLRFEDRPLLFTEPFLWAYQVLRRAFSLGESGVTAVTSCGYSTLSTQTALAVSSLLSSATTASNTRKARSHAACLPALVQFLNYLGGKCPEGRSEKTYLLSLASGLESVSFT